MKIIVIFFALFFTIKTAEAQRLIYNEKAPTIEHEYIIKGAAIDKKKSTYIDFFTLGAPQNGEQLIALEEIALKYHNDMNVLLIVRDKKEKVAAFFSEKPVSYTIICDLDGKTFKNFGVKFVPFAVLIDKKGNFIWQGNNKSFTKDLARQARF